MAGGSRIAIHIAVTTVCTSMGGVTAHCASRLRCHAIIIMTDCRHGASLLCTASAASAELQAILRASRRSSHLPCAKAMAGGRRIAIHIAVATVCTSVSRVTTHCASRLRDHAGIIVSRRLTLRRTANRASLRFRASCVLPFMIAIHHPGDRATIILHHVTRPGCIAGRIVSRSHDTLECITTITGRITQEHDFS